MLQIPQWSAAGDYWDRGKVVDGGRRTYGPFKSPGVPGIVSRHGPFEVRNNQVRDKHSRCDALDECADSHEKVQRVPTAAGLVGVNAPRHPEQAGNVHQIESEMESDQEEPEMEFAKAFVQHSSGDFWVPVIKCPEEGEQNSAHDHIMKMRDDKVGTAELPV